jgi:hypothetical protein
LLLAGTMAIGACDNAPNEAPATEAQPSPVASVPAPTASSTAVVADVVTPTVYPPPVSGGISEANVGTFDLVDGLAYPAPDGSGTLVYVTSKSIASPVLARSACPRVFAESLARLRDAGFAEVTLDAEGKSPYFGYGHAYGGTGKSLSPNDWTTTLETAGDKVSGSARQKYYGEFTFDLPLGAAQPAPAESTDSAANIAVYDRVRTAAKAGDLKGVLVAQGFDDASIAAIRGLPDINADLVAYAKRFLEPGTPKEGSIHPSGFYVDGKKADGKGYWNYYGFQKCGDALVLTSIHEDARD